MELTLGKRAVLNISGSPEIDYGEHYNNAVLIPSCIPDCRTHPRSDSSDSLRESVTQARHIYVDSPSTST